MKTIPEVLWAERTREEIPAWAQKGTVVIVPIGSIEQHGHHLPLDTDCRTVEYVARRAACLAEELPVLVTPTMPLGISPHHMMYAGTITLRVETAIRFLEDVCTSLTHHGFERILILSGHGGNGDTIGAAALELRFRLQRQIQATCWFSLIPQVFETLREGPPVGIGHAGEMETSAILALAPDSVHTDRLHLVSSISDDPITGKATKGAKLLEAGAEAVVQLLRRMAQQPGREVIGIETYKKP
jgi:creatinine amidohydrolase